MEFYLRCQPPESKTGIRFIRRKFHYRCFNDDYTAIELLERSGIDPQKASLKIIGSCSLLAFKINFY